MTSSIPLTTSKLRNIENSQGSIGIPRDKEVQFREVYRGRYRIRERTSRGTDYYNCFGLVFASRRTRVGPDDIWAILEDDHYSQVEEINILPGDIALYVGDRNEVIHAAVVIEVPSKDGTTIVPIVFSKWGPWVEVIHPAYECPYIREYGGRLMYFRVQDAGELFKRPTLHVVA